MKWIEKREESEGEREQVGENVIMWSEFKKIRTWKCDKKWEQVQNEGESWEKQDH